MIEYWIVKHEMWSNYIASCDTGKTGILSTLYFQKDMFQLQGVQTNVIKMIRQLKNKTYENGWNNSLQKTEDRHNKNLWIR